MTTIAAELLQIGDLVRLRDWSGSYDCHSTMRGWTGGEWLEVKKLIFDPVFLTGVVWRGYIEIEVKYLRSQSPLWHYLPRSWDLRHEVLVLASDPVEVISNSATPWQRQMRAQ